MLSKKKKKKNNEKKIAIKLILSLIYIIVITVLSVSAYQIFKEKQVIKTAKMPSHCGRHFQYTGVKYDSSV